MENKNDKTEQNNEGFSARNLPEDYNPAPTKLKQELETDEDGERKIVARQRPEDQKNQKPSPDYSSEEKMDLARNKDRNYDVADNRYPAGHPENERDRGNIKLDDEQ